MKAIVYQSNAGHTKRYAELFAQLTDLPVYDRKDAGKKIGKADEIIFFGWLCAGAAPGYPSVAKRYKVRAFCVVGMGRPVANQIAEVAQKYGIALDNAFYLQGGFDLNKIHGFYKLMMKTFRGFAGKALANKTDKTEEEIEMLKLFSAGGDYVSEDNLQAVLNWYKLNG